MTPKLRRILNLIGAVLAIAGIIFVVFRLQVYSAELDWTVMGVTAWATVLALSMVYGLANVLLGLGWWQLLRTMGDKSSWLGALRVYGLSQLAKYVPGNVFQLAGRQALGMAQGMSAGALAKSMLLELILIAVAGILFVVLVLPLWFAEISSADALGLMLVTAAMLLVMLYRKWAKPVAWAMLGFILFLAISGSLFVELLVLVNAMPSTAPPIVGAFILAWLAGFVTPGAPAGVGVRELVLLVLLEDLVMPADLLLAVLLGRVVTVLGDVGFFVSALALPAHRHGG